MAAIIKIDQEGLSEGVPGEDRIDGVATGALVTVTSTDVEGTTHLVELLQVPDGDTTAVSSLGQTPGTPQQWTFSPTPNVAGTYVIRLTVDQGEPTESVQTKIFGIRTSTASAAHVHSGGAEGNPIEFSHLINLPSSFAAAAHDVSAHSGTIGAPSQVGLGNVSNHAQLRRSANDWANFTEETAPANSDLVLVERTSDGFKRKIQIGNLPGSAGSGEINAGVNIGTSGVGIYKQKSGVNLEMKRLNPASSKLSIVEDTVGDKIDIDVVTEQVAHQQLAGAGSQTHLQIDEHLQSQDNPHAVTKAQVGLGNLIDQAQLTRADNDWADMVEETGPATTDMVLIERGTDGGKRKVQLANLTGGDGGGEINTASNVGMDGVGLFKQKSGVELQFKKINSGSSKLTVTDDASSDEVDIDIVPNQIEHNDLADSGVNSHEQIDSHLAAKTNPHMVTSAQVGLGNVTNDAQVKKSASSTDSAVVRWNGPSGDRQKDSGVIINDNDQIEGVRTLGFAAEYDNGNSGAASLVNWNNGEMQRITLDNAAPVFTLEDPPGPCRLTLKCIQDSTGNRQPVWPANVKWQGGTAVPLSGADSTDIISFYFDGTDYYGVTYLDFS